MFIIILIDDIDVSILYTSPEPNTFPKVNEVDKENWRHSGLCLYTFYEEHILKHLSIE